jgi:hypothetical protein
MGDRQTFAVQTTSTFASEVITYIA